MNIVGNALKYTARGFIDVSLSIDHVAHNPTAFLPQYPGREEPAATVSLAVRDTGLGISKEFLMNHILKPFSQEDILASGAGLELSVVDQIAKSMGGCRRLDLQCQKTMSKANLERETAIVDLVALASKRPEGCRIRIPEDLDSKRSEDGGAVALKAEERFARSLTTMLRDWFRVETIVATSWVYTPQTSLFVWNFLSDTLSPFIRRSQADLNVFYF
ncbi:hypothetical protein RBB50_012819 [Rhinocladiella similis]